jgi:hypothetical protein
MGWAQPVTVSFSLSQSSITIHEPVEVQFAVQNGGQESIHLDLGANRMEGFAFSITQPDGTTVQPSAPGEGGLTTEGEVSVLPGQTYTQNLLLNEWYDFAKPGNYKIAVKLTASIQTQSGSPVTARSSQETPLTVSARDAKRLEDVCHSLADKAIQSPDYASAADAALALSYVRDPVAVLSLSRVLREGTLVKEQAIAGLVRIGNHEAVRALRENEEKADPELKAQIRAALDEIRTGVHPSADD